MWVIAFLFGVSIGSFLNVCIDRLPKGESIVKGRSHCDFCKRILHWYELIPIFSWLMQLGRSLCCKKTLSIQYPLVECITGLAFIIISTAFPYSPVLIFAWVCISISIIVFTISDIKYQLLPTPLFYVWAVGIIVRFIGIHASFSEVIYSYMIPAIFSGLFFFLLWFFSKGKSMGDGDIYLAFLIGLTVGFPGIIISLYTAFLTGALAGVILILYRKKTLKSHIPFGPFLILGLMTELIMGQYIYSWWMLFI